MLTLRGSGYNKVMKARCRVCGILDAAPVVNRNRLCYPCQGAYQRFRNDPIWGTKNAGGFQTVRGKLRFEGPVREVPNTPSTNWFRYIVRERLLRGFCRYPYAHHRARESDPRWYPDKMPPWDDVHTVPSDIGKMTPAQAIALELIDVPHEQPDQRLSEIGPWGPPTVGI